MKNRVKINPVQRFFSIISTLLISIWMIFCVALWISKTGAQGVKYFGKNLKPSFATEIILKTDNFFNEHFWSLF